MIKSMFLLLLLSFSFQCLCVAEVPEKPSAEPISARQMIDEHLQQREQAEKKDETIANEATQSEIEFPPAVEADEEELTSLNLSDACENDDLTPAAATETISLEAEAIYEKADSLPPALLLRGTPGIDEDSGQKKEDIIGRFIPEPHPLNRRQRFYRWVLETLNGQRVPLKSNLKLLQEIRSEKFLDGYVKLHGYFLESGFNEQLKYFVVESVAAYDDPDGLVEPAVVEEIAPASFTLRDKIRR